MSKNRKGFGPHRAKAVVFAVIVLNFLVFNFIGIGCGKMRGSPFSDRLLQGERNLNQRSTELLSDVEADGMIRIAVIADSHQNYRDLEGAIGELKQVADTDFLVNLGDFTNSSYNMEYDQFLRSYQLIAVPAFTVPGNHDLIGAGPSLFKQAFGSVNFYFESTTYRFIFFNSANLESPEDFSPSWLLQTVQSSAKPVLIFTHVELRDEERFFGDVAATMNQVIADSRVKAVLNGHDHVYRENYDASGTLLLQAPRVEGPQWLVFEIQAGNFRVFDRNGEKIAWRAFKP